MPKKKRQQQKKQDGQQQQQAAQENQADGPEASEETKVEVEESKTEEVPTDSAREENELLLSPILEATTSSAKVTKSEASSVEPVQEPADKSEEKVIKVEQIDEEKPAEQPLSQPQR